MALTACGGGASTESKQDTSSLNSGSLITSNTSAEVVAYEKHVWKNLSDQSRCGRCHSTGGGQSPMFVADNITTAYAEALSFVNGVQVANLASPNDSRMVTFVRAGHQPQACWLASNDLCADAIRDFIIAWNNETAGTAAVQTGVTLVAPPIRSVAESKTFPASSGNFATLIHTPLLTQHCAGCHTPSSPSQQSPFFASNDVDASYLAAQQKMDLLNPANSRFVLKISGEDHHCWTSDCNADALTMQNAITAFANTIAPTQVDQNLIVSKALKLQPPEALIASGGERHALNQIALWEFKAGSGNQAFDTSGVAPAMNLTLSGDYSWVGGYGVQFRNGRAKSTVESSKKLLNNLRTRGEYSVEAWIIPANVVQQNRNIISYSGGATQRNFTIAQNEYNYQFYNRMTFPSPAVTNLNGGPVLESDANEEFLQASQQHIVMNYDPILGRRMFVNGVQLPAPNNIDTNDVGGTLTDWSDIFSFTLANESGVSNPWQGTFRMVAIHNRALTQEQITQNF
ncbi:MAG: LamG domain-containing protein, partial [Gammaproteobacteria bacterium]|nr:LamG domain-containing protein [Gammaproteobacteria bacterium]